jgi:4-oxalocrotonate tautomerase family enzyme
MPLVQIDGPILTDVERKRKLAKLLTQAAAAGYGMSEEHIIVVIRENSSENVASGGQLVADRRQR